MPVQFATRVLGVSESGYYEWRGRAPSARAVRHAWLTGQIQAVHRLPGTCGSRRVHAELALGLGIRVGHGAVEMLMRRAGIKGLPGNRRHRPKHQAPTAEDLVKRQFTRPAPDQLWAPVTSTAALLLRETSAVGRTGWSLAATYSPSESFWGG